MAIKVVPLQSGAPDTDPTVQSLRRELAVILKAARSCHFVCKYHGVARKGNDFLIVMELYKVWEFIPSPTL